LHNYELHRLYSSLNTVTVIKPRGMKWARMEEGRGEVFTGFWLGGPKGKDHWDDLGVGGRITKWTLGRQGSMGRTGFGWLCLGSGGGLL